MADHAPCACSAVQAANASGVLFSPLPGQDLEQADCHGAECDVPLSIWASMVPRSAAVAIAEVCGLWQTLSDAMSHQFSESRCVWNLFCTCGDYMVSNDGAGATLRR